MSAFNSGWSAWGGGGPSGAKKRQDGGGAGPGRQARQSSNRGTMFLIRFLIVVILVQALYIVKLKVSQQRRLILEEGRGNNGDGGNTRAAEAADSDKFPGIEGGQEHPKSSQEQLGKDSSLGIATTADSADSVGAGNQAAAISTQPDGTTVTPGTETASNGDEKQSVELPRGDNAVVTLAGGSEGEGSGEQGAGELGEESEMDSKDEEEVGSRREASERAAEAEAGARAGAETDAGEPEAGGRDGSGEAGVTSAGQRQAEGQGQVSGALAQLRGGGEGGRRWEPLRGPAEGMSCRAWLEEQDAVAVGRDFERQPVRVAANEVKRWDCDVPCEFVGEGDDVDGSLTYAVPGKMVLRSMEARSYYPINDPAIARKSHSVVMTVHYDSDVPVQYGSWEEYDIMRPPVPKTADAIAAAFISNCAANNFRLKAVEELQKFFTVHSYGRCLNNRPYEHDKLAVIQRYKFSLAFENSCEPDYITEKFWQSLVAGSVPVVVGPPNIADFVPDNNSYLHIPTEADIPRVAQQMQALASDDEAYNKMLEWKRSGPSDQFITNVDLSAVHSSCRLCVLLADRIRTHEIAVSSRPRPCRCESVSESGKKQLTYHLYVRERGTYQFTSVFLTKDSLTLPGLRRAIRRTFKKKSYKPVWVGKRPAVLASEKRIKALRIFHVYPAGSNQKEAMFGSAWFQTSAQFAKFLDSHPCPRLEVIFI
ncbi:hypothetical protein CLOM_g2164 [Closterium sp. NIES-68]|nr:hypothetical protein CLOM_g2164 [Closterium sp. NIES-68]